jgi:hypothetical protein
MKSPFLIFLSLLKILRIESLVPSLNFANSLMSLKDFVIRMQMASSVHRIERFK